MNMWQKTRFTVVTGLMLSLANILASQPLYANWYEATGQARIERGDINHARRAAIEDALQRATLFAGARLESQQQVIQGILQHHQVTLSSSAELKQVQLISETHRNQQVFITLKAHIVPTASSCNTRYRNTLLLTDVHLAARQDAIYGQLFQLGEHSSRQLAAHLKDFAPALLLKQQSQPLFAEQLDLAAAEQFFEQGQQFILLANIYDLSLGNKASKFWQSSVRERFFALEVQIFDTFERRIRFQREYRASSHWPDQDKHTPSSHSMAFWQMPYGQKIDQTLRAVALDIQQETQCQPVLATIQQVKQQQVHIRLGSIHGLAVGDHISLMQVQRDPQHANIRRLVDSPIQLTITEVNTDGAWAASASQQLINHIQEGDIVSVVNR